ncbi:MAG: hypothetical protein F6K63_33470 [Moorea sp. SIO1G6]|uniref:hypothetical protein n=1 Tax=Moorena sp. SIO1G6 TaxID=2607840 RepID=UPI0013BF1B2A|nr:hypothetical protein [Moorena sp. SIO1G6]NES83822.1 hypothetical protein [Moorena sp. SIO2B7]NET69046.1 hypothetical protein [Moorena sp. SIO1G6]
MGNAIIRKWSDKTYPGFEELKNYIESCQVIQYRNDEVHRDDDGNQVIWFKDAPGGDPSREMEVLLNVPKYRHFHNLMPAGTDPVTAFCQLMVLRYRSQLNLDNEFGTYLIRFHVWTDVYANKNEAQLSQQVMFSYSVGSNKEKFQTIICL